MPTVLTKERLAVVMPYLAWFLALSALLGSLYFSEIAGFAPCVLCWYQRVFLYPLVLIIPVGILGKDKHLPRYVLPLSIVGLGVAIFQNLLTWGVISEAASPCKVGVSCTTKYIEWFGFVTIPFLSLVCFLIITIAMIIQLRTTSHD